MAPRTAACNKRLFHFVAADMAAGSATKTFFSLVELGEVERALIARTTSRAFLDTVLANERHILCAVRRCVKRRAKARAEKMGRAANVSEMRCSGGRRVIYTRADRSRNRRLRNEKEM